VAEVGHEVDAGTGAECSGPGETLEVEVEAEPERFLDGALVRWSSDGAAAQHGGAERRAVLRGSGG
jgi:hypothetical protein